MQHRASSCKVALDVCFLEEPEVDRQERKRVLWASQQRQHSDALPVAVLCCGSLPAGRVYK